MSNIEDPYFVLFVVDSIENAILAHSDAPPFLKATTEHLGSRWAKPLAKVGNGPVNAFDGILGQFAQGRRRPGIYQNAIGHNLPARFRRSRTSV